ncbi:Flagellar hook-associated protein FliD [Methylophaga thiooxydans]|uniref:Flagellar hook-associated protein 2 n=1 Tax=Methylophaga thiooxydans TaxID=392484 RepID=A0A0A0BK14_9GAMM|nr:flagellar filament capping protein FliD [Methylophaga thiooxydans]KGM08195.1 Flagellar hook-associated protein FliD [Methylophaga thiooxydans]
MAITAAGIGSGLDIESLVSQLVAAEGQPAINRLDTQEAKLQANLSAFGSLKSALSNFQTAVQSLQTDSSFQGRKASSSNNELFTASASTQATQGQYDIEIEQLAQAAKLTSNSGDFAEASDVVGTGTLTINFGSESFSLTIDESNNTLAGIRSAINNAEDNPGVTATIVSSDNGPRLVLSSDDLGSGNAITTVATDNDAGDGNDLARLNALENNVNSEAAKDAVIYVDGQKVTRNSNSFSDVIDGVTLSLAKAEVGTVEKLTISRDESATKSKINSFIKAYNALATTTGQLSSYNADTGAAGQLLGDSTLRSVQSQIRQAITSSVSGLDFGTLAEIGITTDENNNLVLDEEKLDQVLATDYASVSGLFSSETGVANKLNTILEGFVGTEGLLNTRTDGIESSIGRIDDQREQLAVRLESVEARYRAQFSAMDILVGQLQGIGDFLTQQLASLPAPNSINSN